MNIKNITICFYHNEDLDGYASAAIVNKYYSENTNHKLFMKGVDYGVKDDIEFVKQTIDKFIEDFYAEIRLTCKPNDVKHLKSNILEDDITVKVIVVDYSFSIDIMESLYATYELIWIDHHTTSIMDSISKQYFGTKGRRLMDKAACELTWDFYYRGTKLPTNIRLLSKYDIFDFTDHIDADDVTTVYDEHSIKCYQTYMNVVKDNFKLLCINASNGESLLYKQHELFFDESKLHEFIKEGEVLLDSVKTKAINHCIENGKLVILSFNGLIISRYAYVIMGHFGSYEHAVRAITIKDYGVPDCIIRLVQGFGEITVGICTNMSGLNAGDLAKQIPNGGGHVKVAGAKCKDFDYNVLTNTINLRY